MPTEFDARHVQATKEDWGHLIIWSLDDNLEAEKYVMLQAKDEYTQQDVRFGMNDIYVECCGQGWSWYGHIERFHVSSARVEVQLDASAAERMCNDGRFIARFTLPDAKYQELLFVLRKIFAGRDYYAET